ncbi:hypothetical protein BN1723_010153 [Verticillium longisporum]|uniref:N-acetylgalactosaminide beta-1,3-galactosyltransferase n=1 Tax=Verticillium longisporum TaxID=100787 RepID=A0A0G4KVV4_VERLO|nr:hypothetical protein BN1723_010153 [Verticillium longisporum]
MGWLDGRHESCMKLGAVNMLSRRALIAVSITVCALIVLALSSSRLGEWTTAGLNYKHLPPHHPAPAGHPGHPHKPPPVGDNDHVAPSDDDEAPDIIDTPNVPDTKAKEDPPKDPAANGLFFRPKDPVCDSFPDTSNILLVMKTGATEAFNRVPTQLMTMLKCVPEYFIFSDLAETIGGYQIRDSLDTVLAAAMDGNEDFDLYRRQQACAVDQESCNKLAEDKNEGWNLDKYKNVHIAEKTFNMRPNYEWYIFVDADTYVLWPTLVQWLKRLDPHKKHYLGSVTMIHGFNFGHGGSGYIISHAAMKEMVADHPGVANQFDTQIQQECCGDYIFARALHNTTQTRVRNTWPTINGEKPFTLPFGPNQWCHPIVTMHHMNSEEISTFWEYESRRYAAQDMPSTPPALRIKDIYHEFVKPRLHDSIDDWHNLSSDRFYFVETPGGRQFGDHEKGRVKTEKLTELEKRAHLSFDDCRAACEEITGCFQFHFDDGLCAVSWSFKMGHPIKKKDEDRKRMRSGWNMNRINAFIEQAGDCGNVKWPEVS